jgi:hypothetical protein
VKYHRFQLLISSAAPARGYTVHALTPRGQGRAQFDLPILYDEAGSLRAALNGRNLLPEGTTPKCDPEDVGERLFQALLRGEILRLYERNLDLLGADPEVGLRLELTLDPRDPNLSGIQALPWELLRQPGTPEFLALNRRLPITRFLEVPRPVYAAPRPCTLRILAVMAVVRHPELQPLALDRELANLRQAVGSAVEVVTPATPTLAAMHRVLGERQCHVLHFMGHGGSVAELPEPVLFFAAEDGSADPVQGVDLVNQLAGFPTLRLVVLNACQSATVAEAGTADKNTQAFAGVSNALVLGGLPAVIAMQLPISDAAAIAFSRAFYRQLAAGDPVDAAVAEGRQAVHSVDRLSSEWATPVLFLRTPTGELYPEEDVWTPSARKRKTRQWIAGLLALFLAVAAGVVSRNWRVERPVNDGVERSPSGSESSPDFRPNPTPPPSNKIEVIGLGFPPSGIGGERGKFLARRAAEVDARRKLAESIKARLVSETKTIGGTLARDTATMTVDELVKNAHVVAEKELSEGGYEIRMSALLRGKEKP